MARPLLLVLADANAVRTDSRVVLGVGMLVSLLSNFLEVWMAQATTEKAAATVKQHMAQHAAGGLAYVGRVGGRAHLKPRTHA